MLIFLFIVVAYILANFYMFLKLSSLINVGAYADVLIGTVVFIMTILPVLIPVYSHKGSDKSVMIFSYIGYMWLAFLVPFFPAAVILDMYNLAVQYSSFSTGHSIMLSPEQTFYIPLILSLAIIVYGFFEAGNIRTENLVIKTPKLPKETGRVRIAQISDLHLGVIVSDKTLDKVIEKIEKEKPDIIVSTGDLVDGIVRHIDHLAGKIKRLHARMGKFAIMGNHEIYGGTAGTAGFLEDAGFTLLRGEGSTIANVINIAGMDFSGGEARRHSKESRQRPEKEILSELPSDLFTLLLKHRSDVEEECLGLFDLQLSGHSHKGQIFPMNLATMFIFKHHTGFTKLAKGAAIYTSRGTGTAGPPIRFLSTPEITIIDVESE